MIFELLPRTYESYEHPVNSERSLYSIPAERVRFYQNALCICVYIFIKRCKNDLQRDWGQ